MIVYRAAYDQLKPPLLWAAIFAATAFTIAFYSLHVASEETIGLVGAFLIIPAIIGCQSLSDQIARSHAQNTVQRMREGRAQVAEHVPPSDIVRCLPARTVFFEDLQFRLAVHWASNEVYATEKHSKRQMLVDRHVLERAKAVIEGALRRTELNDEVKAKISKQVYHAAACLALGEEQYRSVLMEPPIGAVIDRVFEINKLSSL